MSLGMVLPRTSASVSASGLASLFARTSLSSTRHFGTTSPSHAKSPPGRGKDALRKARRQKLLDQKKQVRLLRKGLTSDPDALAQSSAVVAMTHQQRMEKREQEKRDEELKLDQAGDVLRLLNGESEIGANHSVIGGQQVISLEKRTRVDDEISTCPTIKLKSSFFGFRKGLKIDQKAHSISRPLQAYELHIVTTVSSHQSNALRGRLSLPKDPRTKGEHIVIFCEEGSETYNEILQIASELGIKVNTNTVSEDPSSSSATDIDLSQTTITIGGQSLISAISSNRFSTNFTKVLSTSSILPTVSRTLARSLGPKGLMPSVKRGTVASTSKEFYTSIRDAKGSMDWRGDRNGVVRGKCGRLDFDNQDLKKNVRAILEAVVDRVSSGMGQGGSNQSGNQGVQQVKVFNESSLMAKRTPGQLKKGEFSYFCRCNC